MGENQEQKSRLHRWEETKEKAQGEYAYTSGADQMRAEERERQRDRLSRARPEGSSSQLTSDRVLPEGMAGAGGGDVDDMGAVGYPDEASGSAGAVERLGEDEVDARLHDGLRRVAGTGGMGDDVEIRRSMGSGDMETAPGLSAERQSAADIRNAQRTARDLTSDGNDTGAPWDRVDDGSRIDPHGGPRS
jgi:hypothetical protein